MVQKKDFVKGVVDKQYKKTDVRSKNRYICFFFSFYNVGSSISYIYFIIKFGLCQYGKITDTARFPLIILYKFTIDKILTLIYNGKREVSCR